MDIYHPSNNYSNLSFNKKQKQEIEALGKSIIGDEKYLIGEGADGRVYYSINNKINGKDEGFVFKVSYSENDIEDDTLKRKNCSFEKEIKVLKLVKKLKKNSQQFVHSFKIKDNLNNDRNVMVTTFIEGSSPNYDNLNKKSLSSIYKSLYQLDKRGILHRDLKKENIKIDNNTAKILDYGAAEVFVLSNPEEDLTRFNFPDFEVPSNLRNFLDTLLMPLLKEIYDRGDNESRKKASSLFKFHLYQERKFHKKKVKFLSKQKSKLKNFSVKEEKRIQLISRMINYEYTLYNVLKKPSKEIWDLELLKNNITFYSEIAYKNEILYKNNLVNGVLKYFAFSTAILFVNDVNKFLYRYSHLSEYQPKKDQDNKPKQENNYETDSTKLSLSMEISSSSKENNSHFLFIQRYLDYKKEEGQLRIIQLKQWINGIMDWLDFCNKNTDESNKIMKSTLDQYRNIIQQTSFIEIPKFFLDYID